LRPGDHLAITGPRNNFELDEEAGSYLLIAGGIGVTPLLAMARQLVALNRSVEFHYLVRSRERAAFSDELAAMLPDGALHVHAGTEVGRPDLDAITDAVEGDCQIYACGPEPLLNAIRSATAKWSRGSVQFERFQNSALQSSVGSDETKS